MITLFKTLAGSWVLVAADGTSFPSDSLEEIQSIAENIQRNTWSVLSGDVFYAILKARNIL